MFEETLFPQDIQYMGMPGASRACLAAVDTIVNSEIPPTRASVVTWMKDRIESQDEHLFLFWDWNHVPMTVVHSGFASGYPGEAPRSFSEALCMVIDRQIPITQIFVGKVDFDAIEERRLTREIIQMLRNSDERPILGRWYEIYDTHWEEVENQTFWTQRHSVKLNFDHLDSEIATRCRILYAQDPAAAVSSAMKIVEQRLCIVLNKPSGFGIRLITEAFDPNKGVLTDKTLPKSEREGIFQLFGGAMKSVRNPMSHRFIDKEDEQLYIDLIYLADHLLRKLPPLPNNDKKNS